MLQEGGKRADRWFVAGHHGNNALGIAAADVQTDSVIGCFASYERKAHTPGSIELAVRYSADIVGREQPERQILFVNAASQRVCHCLYLGLDAPVTLAISFGANDPYC